MLSMLVVTCCYVLCGCVNGEWCSMSTLVAHSLTRMQCVTDSILYISHVCWNDSNIIYQWRINENICMYIHDDLLVHRLHK